MTWVKICGITNLEDALIAVDAGADAVGFVFHEKSPRKVDVETARAIVAELPERVEKVGVFVEQSAEDVHEIVRHAGLTAVQIHQGPGTHDWSGDQDSLKAWLGVDKLIVAVPALILVREGLFVTGEGKKHIFALLVDSGAGGMPGGTGKSFDWEQARGVVERASFLLPVIVAGGLQVTNVSRAMELLQPFGVDVASGVEAKPGKKDPEKVQAFVRAVRQADQKAV